MRHKDTTGDDQILSCFGLKFGQLFLRLNILD